MNILSPEASGRLKVAVLHVLLPLTITFETLETVLRSGLNGAAFRAIVWCFLLVSNDLGKGRGKLTRSFKEQDHHLLAKPRERYSTHIRWPAGE
jgi:hypothetical protein